MDGTPAQRCSRDSANLPIPGRKLSILFKFSFLTRTGTLALRLAEGDRESFLKKYRSRLCEQHGRVLEDWVEVPDALLKRTPELKKYFDLSFTHVRSLKPKPTKEPAKKKAKAGGKKAAKKRRS